MGFIPTKAAPFNDYGVLLTCTDFPTSCATQGGESVTCSARLGAAGKAFARCTRLRGVCAECGGVCEAAGGEWRQRMGGVGAHVPQLSTGLVGVAGRRPVHQHCSIFHSTCSGNGRTPLIDGWRLL